MNAQQTPYAVLIGPLGSGKTSLAEKLSGKSCLGSRKFGDSATRGSTIYWSRTRRFMFADTPGYLVMDEKVDHALNIILALEYRPLSRIFILCKFENRPSLMVRNVRDIFQPLVDWLDFTTVVVTFWDTSDRVEATRQKVEAELSRHLGITSFLYSSPEASDDLLEQSMSVVLLGPPRSLSIPVEKITTYFDVKMNDLQIANWIKQHSNEFRDVVNDVTVHANGFHNAQEKEDFAFLAQIALKDMIVDIKGKFAAAFQMTMLDVEEFASVEALHIQLMATLKDYRSFCRSFNNFSKGCDSAQIPFRQCPYCNQVWIKLEGCEGETTCGSRVSVAEPSVHTNYVWRFVGPLQASFATVLDRVLARKRQTSAAYRGGQGQGVGCGNKISWKDMKPFEVPVDLMMAIVHTDEMTVADSRVTGKVFDDLQKRKNKAAIRQDL